ncbi:MAG: D-2-hydroxyacid dehydrogenase [Haloarcula sp.]
MRWIQGLSSGLQRFTDDDYVTGYEPPGLDRLRDEGVVLTNVAGIHAEPAGEHVLGYLLSFERNLHLAVRKQVAGEWGGYGGVHGELVDKRLAVIGVGAIGGRVAELGNALGMTVVGTKRDPATAPGAVDGIYGPDGLDAALAGADYVVVTCPLTDETRELVDADAFATMREDAVFVNVARGGVVDERALVKALRGDRIRGAALDVFAEEPLPEDSPLWDEEDVLITPHVAGGSPRSDERVAELFARNYGRFLDGDFDGFENRVV